MITDGANRILVRFMEFVRRPKEPAAIMGVAAYTLFIMFLVAVVNSTNMAWGVYAGDRLIAVTADASVARATISRLIDESRAKGENSAQLEGLTIKKAKVAEGVTAGGDLQAAVREACMPRVKGVELVVNGKALLAMNSRKEAQQLLDELKAPYAGQDGVTRFAEDVRLVDAVVDKKEIVNVGRGLEIVRIGTKKTATYQIKDGDTLWDIAGNLGVSVEKLMASNPGLRPSRLQEGDVINLDRVENLINIETVLTKVVTEEIGSPVEERKDSSLFAGERRVLAQGRSGKREVTYEVVLRNGAEVERREVNEVVLEEPQPKVVATGTRTLLASRGGGRLAWPAVGYISSGYGPRGGGMHTGIDIGTAYGSPVGAAESGTVIMAQWYSGYGKCIDISHGDGVVTRYAHLSSINVSVGQAVERGEFIGRVGDTGIATGPHLHFEVIVGGRRVDPMRFL